MNTTSPPRRLITLAGASALLLLSGCGASDTATSPTADAGGAAGATTTASGNCASVKPRTDDFHQAVTLTTTTADGLRYGDISPGAGAQAAAGKNVTMNYSGWTQDGKLFDSSRQSGRTPFEVDNLGQGPVIQGWNEGIQGMKLGGVRRLVIPPALAYGAQPPPGAPIPPNATLTFDVELVCILN
ncbi:MAG: Peptidyl-prolyl cis-trans isomerase 5 [Chloroflexi bacterium]|nr:Peptidyl-prolyl cis-trans isomerase 5 [Chloroflexota bacterium]